MNGPSPALVRITVGSLLAFAALAPLPATSTTVLAAPPAAGSAQCRLDPARGQIKHVIELQFDNVHFRRDNPNVPSDVEQMPNLYNFLVGSGTVLANHHTPLIAHTGTDILTTLTGLYPDNHGQAVSNTYDFYDPSGVPHTALSFAYWTDKTQAFDGTINGTTNLIGAGGGAVPAPWVPFTRAGCNVGGVGTANIELERTSNVATVYGAGSPEAQEAATNPDAANADFIGIAIHCAKGAALCSNANHGQPDVLPGEPGGYTGYQGLFGHKYVAPTIGSGGQFTDLNGNLLTGFPGFNGMQATNSLAYVAGMQEHGVPVTYAYISAAHEKADTGLGPGDPTYVANLRAYDDAFGKFFARLANDGINKSNTLFAVLADENDHFVGAGPTPANCNGLTIPCIYDPNRLGNVEVALDTLLQQQGINTQFGIHSDSAPVFYLNGQPAQASSTTRSFERAVGNLRVSNPLTHQNELMTNYLADQAQLRLMHMLTGDPSRNPTFVQFAKPDYVGVTGGLDCTNDPAVTVMLCPGIEVWNHGDLHPDVNVTWLGMVGPGIAHRGIDSKTWTDHVDVRPTIMTVLGLRDDYIRDGRPITEILSGGEADSSHQLQKLGQVFKQINAPVGDLTMLTIKAATAAMLSGSPADDVPYSRFDQAVVSITNDRNALAAAMELALGGSGGAEQGDSDGHVQRLIQAGLSLLERAQELGGLSRGD